PCWVSGVSRRCNAHSGASYIGNERAPSAGRVERTCTRCRTRPALGGSASSEGLAVISLQDVGGIRARLTTKEGVARFSVLEADTLQQANTREVAGVGDAEHLLNASGRKDELE